MKKSISILGSTGSIGTQTLEVAKDLNIKIEGISSNKNIDLLEKQIRQFKPKIATIIDEKNALILKKNVADTSTKILCGEEGLCNMCAIPSVDTVVTAVSGISGLIPTMEAIRFSKNIALANKETLVTAGKFVKKEASLKKISVLPIDSEHSAIFQCLQNKINVKNIKKLILTASGGPFFGKTLEELKDVSLNEALNHPSWKMGNKISIDSATLMNKGLEIIEAVHFFNVEIDNIEVVVHKESIVHSMVEFKDNSVIAQMSLPSMKIPIQYALTYPERFECNVEGLNLSKLKKLSFFEPDYNTFEAINLCKSAFNNNLCVVLNAGNEKAVELFLNKKIKFLDILKLIKYALDEFKMCKIKSINDIILLDKKVKNYVELISKKL